MGALVKSSFCDKGAPGEEEGIQSPLSIISLAGEFILIKAVFFCEPARAPNVPPALFRRISPLHLSPAAAKSPVTVTARARRVLSLCRLKLEGRREGRGGEGDDSHVKIQAYPPHHSNDPLVPVRPRSFFRFPRPSFLSSRLKL